MARWIILLRGVNVSGKNKVPMAEWKAGLAALGYTNIYDLGGILSWPYEIEGDFEGHF